MSNPENNNPSDSEVKPTEETTESFADALSQFERSHAAKPDQSEKGREATVITVNADSVILDIGFKSEGVLPLTAFRSERDIPKPGDKLLVHVKGRDTEGYYQLSLGKIRRPTDWEALEKAFNDKATILGTVTGVVKGGLSVDVGVRAFMPASRTGTRDAAEMEKLVEQEIRCRITKIDVADEDVVVDRRIISEEEERAEQVRRYSELKEGDTVQGTVRSLTDYGAFVDIGGVDALLHVGEISWQRVASPADVLSPGQQIEARILKIDPDKRRISITMKQLLAHPWEVVPEKYKAGQRVRGTVTRIMDFGAFVEVEPGIEGLIHISEMSWAKKVRHPSDIVKPGDSVEAVILGVNTADRKMALGLKQALGDPWVDISQKVAAGSVVEGPITRIAKFGAFLQVAEGVDGMIHVSEMSAEKRINHPQDVVKVGQVVRAQVLSLDTEKRMMKLSMKQLVPSGLDEYIAEHKVGDVVNGRLMQITDGVAQVELGQGVLSRCRMDANSQESNSVKETTAEPAKADLSSLTSMLQARWKSGGSSESKPESARTGQIREFRITKLNPEAKEIELEIA